MTCYSVILPNSDRAIVCGQTRRCSCGQRATLECDWKVATRKSGTCDRPICARCTTSPAPDKDLCPTHVDAYAQWLARQSAKKEARNG